MRVLITGIGGRVGRLLAAKLHADGHEVSGIDRRPWPDAPKGIEVLRADIRKRAAENVFRTRRPEVVIHMATVTHLTASREERHRINLGGTRSVFDHCGAFGVRHVIFVGRHTYYGAAPDSPLFHTEDEPPMAVSTYPELSDLVAADLFAGSALWRYPEMTTSVLRFVYTLGPTKSGTLSSFLRGPRVPRVMGFDPLFQFIHEADIVSAIEATVETELRGVYNVSGPAPVPLSVLIRATGRKEAPIPEPVFIGLLGRFGLPKLPRGALNHIKFPVVIDSSSFREATGWDHSYDEVQTMHAYRWA